MSPDNYSLYLGTSLGLTVPTTCRLNHQSLIPQEIQLWRFVILVCSLQSNPSTTWVKLSGSVTQTFQWNPSVLPSSKSYWAALRFAVQGGVNVVVSGWDPSGEMCDHSNESYLDSTLVKLGTAWIFFVFVFLAKYLQC